MVSRKGEGREIFFVFVVVIYVLFSSCCLLLIGECKKGCMYVGSVFRVFGGRK